MNALPKSAKKYSPEEYPAHEREAAERREFLDGEIYQMAGESLSHSRAASVEHYRKIENGLWVYEIYTELSDVLRFEELESELSLERIYDRVELQTLTEE